MDARVDARAGRPRAPARRCPLADQIVDCRPGRARLLVRRTTRGDLAKSWAWRIIVDGRARNLGLGTWPHVSLAEAREKCVVNLVSCHSSSVG